MDCTHRHTFVLSLNSVYGLYTPSHHGTEFEQCIWTVHTVTPLCWDWTVYMDCTHRHTFVLSLNGVYGLYTPSHLCTEFEQCVWTVHTDTPLCWVWTVYMDCTTPSHFCVEFEQCIWIVHSVTPLCWVWTVHMDCTHRHTIVLSLNSVYGLYKPSHLCTPILFFPLCLHFSLFILGKNYEMCHSAKCTCRYSLFWICRIHVGYFSCITDAGARVCFSVYSAYTVMLYFPCWLSIVKGTRSLPYFQTNSPSYDKNYVTSNGQTAATNVLFQWLTKKSHVGILVHNTRSNRHHTALSLWYRNVSVQTTHSKCNKTPRCIQSANTHTHTPTPLYIMRSNLQRFSQCKTGNP
jgi:hypothetical protein